MSAAHERDATPTLVQVIKENRPWATVLTEDGRPERHATSIEDGEGVPRRPLNLDEEVRIPRWQALQLAKTRHVVIIGR